MNQLRGQFLNFWKSQSSAQRVVLIALVASAVVLIFLFVTWSSTPTYEIAFSGLTEADAGQIVEKLIEGGIPYQLKNSTTILVPSEQVYDVRLKMATEGLPQGGNVGFELFTGSTLGMTEFTQRVNYQRAMEGELERTIGSLESVQAVRVHIVTPEKALLTEDQAPTTASITVQEKPGAHLTAAQVRSMTHLVASSVEGLKPENVVVVDVNGNMLASGEEDPQALRALETDSHRAAEVEAAADLRRKVQELLDSALGPNRSVVQATVIMDWTERETKQQSYDPTSVTIRSSNTLTEVYTSTGATVGGIPGAASNLPPAATTALDGEGAGSYQRAENTTNYEITQTETHEVSSPGKIERISVSVLVDGISDAQQLSKLETVIAAASGIDQARGDSLAVQTLAFDRSFVEQQAAEFETTGQNDLYWRIGEAVAVGLLLLALLWYIQRLLANLRLASSQAWTPVLKPVAGMALPGGASGAIPAALSPIQFQENPIAALSDSQSQTIPELPKAELPSLPSREALSEQDEQIQRVLTGMAEENPSTIAEIIQMWLNEDES